MTLADELREFAFLSPPKGNIFPSLHSTHCTAEHCLEEDLDQAPQLFDEKDHDELRASTLSELGSQMRAPLELDGAEYEGQMTTRKREFAEEMSSEEMESIGTMSVEEGETASEVSDLYEQYDRMHGDVGLSELKKRVRKDHERGLAVQRDQKLWNGCIELRIILQKCLTESHKLPSAPHVSHFLQSSEALTSLNKELKEATQNVLVQMLELEDVRFIGKKQKTAEKETLSALSEPFGALWRDLDDQYNALSNFRDTSLDRYHRQAMLLSGASTKKGKLQILHQGIPAQVQAIMQIPKKVSMRAKTSAKEQPAVVDMRLKEIKSPNGDVPEIFDDSEFYQSLMTEFMFHKGALPNPVKASRKPLKEKESVKRMKALYTDVQPKLVNFMTPVEMDRPEFAKQLMQNLFGLNERQRN